MKKISYVVLCLVMICLAITPIKAIDPDVYHGQTGTEEDTSHRGETTTTTYKKITCGEAEIPYMAPKLVHTIYDILKIATPIIIIILGSLDLVKAVIAQKDDEIKKGQQTFIRRLVVGATVFLVFYIVELMIGLIVPRNENLDMWNCVDCFITGDCEGLMK